MGKAGGAVDAPGHADRQRAAGHEPGDQRVGVAGVAVAQKVDAVGPARGVLLGLPQHLRGAALQNGGARTDLADKGEVFQAVVPAQVADGVVIHGAHQQIAPAADGQPCPVQAFLPGVGHHLKGGLFTPLAHPRKERAHLSLGQALLFKAEPGRPGVGTGLEDGRGVWNRAVVFCQHHNQFRCHMLPPAQACRYRKVTTWARVQLCAGENRPFPVPWVTPRETAQDTALA